MYESKAEVPTMKCEEAYLTILSELVILVSPWMVCVTVVLGLMIRCDLSIYLTFWSFRVCRRHSDKAMLPVSTSTLN